MEKRVMNLGKHLSDSATESWNAFPVQAKVRGIHFSPSSVCIGICGRSSTKNVV